MALDAAPFSLNLTQKLHALCIIRISGILASAFFNRLMYTQI